MGRGRGKSKKLSVSSNEEEYVVSGEDEKVPVQKRRGRPQKVFKEDFDEQVIEETEEDDSVDTVKSVVSSKEMKNIPNTRKHGRKRKGNFQEKVESIEEKNGVVIVKGSNSDESMKCNGFRHNGSRRKSKPHRAAETGVLCNQDYALT